MANRIGVEVTTKLQSGPSNPGTSSGRLHLLLITQKGPADRAVVVRSLAQFEAVYGGRTAYSNSAYDSARLFFEEGGSELVVSRVVGPSATKGVKTLSDQAGTPVPTIKVEALDPGSHSGDISTEVTVSGTSFTFSLYVGGVRVSRYANLSSPAALVAAAQSNPYVKITDLGSATAAPQNNPAASALAPLSVGGDDRAAVTAAMVVDSAALAGEQAAGGAVAAPGYPADVIGSLLLDHAHATKKIALLSMEADATEAEVAEAAATLSTHQYAEYGGIFFPHLTVRDGTGTRTVSPEAYIGAVRNRAHTSDGYWQVPGGDPALTRWTLGTTSVVDLDTNNDLAEGNVNGIATTGSRVRLYNWASLATNDELGLLSARDTLNNLSLVVKDALEPYVFRTIDGKGQLLGYIESAVVGVLEPIARKGGFYPQRVNGEIVDPGYRVIVDSTNNLPDLLAQNEVRVSVSVRLSPTAALIQVEIIKVQLASAV